MNRLDQYLKKARTKKEKIVCAYLTLGFPSISGTEKLVQAFEKAGVGILELGFPYSDPLADGPTIQYASDQALKRQHVHLGDAFSLVRRLRRKGSRLPILFFSYVNPILNFGFAKFLRNIKQSGFDGLIIPDLQPDEARLMEKLSREQKLSLVHLIAPTTASGRMKQIANRSQGFVYYVSLRGVTGARKSLARDLKANIKKIKRGTRKPVLVGFGVSSAGQVKQICKFADGVIVGSAIIESIRKSRGNFAKTVRFAESLVRAAQ